MRVVSLALNLWPTFAVMALFWLVVRAISVRVVWRAPHDRSLDDKTA